MNAESSDKHKFSEDAGMTFQEVYDFAFGRFISLMQNLAKELGEDCFTAMLKRAASEAAVQSGRSRAENVPKNDLAGFTAWAKDPDRFWQHVRTHDAVKHTDTALEIRVTECLWAKTFREGDASDIGYATICYPEYDHCQAFNPQIKLIRTKTLMQGDDCCNHRWVWEE